MDLLERLRKEIDCQKEINWPLSIEPEARRRREGVRAHRSHSRDTETKRAHSKSSAQPNDISRRENAQNLLPKENKRKNLEAELFSSNANKTNSNIRNPLVDSSNDPYRCQTKHRHHNDRKSFDISSNEIQLAISENTAASNYIIHKAARLQEELKKQFTSQGKNDSNTHETHFEIYRRFFREIEQADTHFGGLLKEIRKAYEEKITGLSHSIKCCQQKEKRLSELMLSEQSKRKCVDKKLSKLQSELSHYNPHFRHKSHSRPADSHIRLHTTSHERKTSMVPTFSFSKLQQKPGLEIKSPHFNELEGNSSIG